MSHIVGLCYRNGSKDIILEETLKTEGIPYVRVYNPNQLESLKLRGLVLGEGFESWSVHIERFMEKGGVVLSFRPSSTLAEVFGLGEVGMQKDGYLTVRGREADLLSYEGRLQLFGLSRLYEGGQALAWLSPEEKFGGIIKVRRGSGEALVVAFDMPTTFLTILQPRSECGKRPDASRVEYGYGQIPQIDLIRRLVVGLFIESLHVPLLRKWYFPSCRRALLLLLGDQDGCDFKVMRVVLDLVKELEVPYTLYVTPMSQPISREEFRRLAEEGIEFGFHPDFFVRRNEGAFKSSGRVVRTADPTQFNEEEFNRQLRKAEEDVGFKLMGERAHGARWETVRHTPLWAERAGLQHDSILGVRMWESKPQTQGYWVGTGLPYYFVDPEGYRRIDVLEIPSFGSDNLYFWKPHEYVVAIKPNAVKRFIAGMGVTEEEAFQIARRFLDEAIEKYHTANCYCFHPIYLAARRLRKPVYYTDTFFKMFVNYAKGKNVGLMSIDSWNNFWRAREKVTFKEVEWTPERAEVTYRVSSDVKVDSLTFITPLRFGGVRANVFVNGDPKNYVEATLLGGEYAMFTVDIAVGELLIRVEYS